jgi:hypothetical protein
VKLNDDEFDLFSERQKRAPGAAERAKQEGMERVERGANAAWALAMLETTRAVARSKKRFTSDDVFERYQGAAKTRDYRAFGPVMRRAARLGYCRKAYAPPINSTRASLRASPRTVWESLIFEGH